MPKNSRAANRRRIARVEDARNQAMSLKDEDNGIYNFEKEVAEFIQTHNAEE